MTHVLHSLPVLILYPHRQRNCRCLMCDIWKDTSNEEISPSDRVRHLDDIERLSVRWIVLSGGEPLMHSDLSRFTALLRERGIRLTILTTGLLIERNAELLVKAVDDVIVSLDGPPAIHEEIRRTPGGFKL